MINIRDALDILERAKSSAENIERYAYDCDFGEARLVILELIAEIERLQDLIDKPPEDADWVADYHLLQSAPDGPIIDVARKWHAAYRKAQNSNLMRTPSCNRPHITLAMHIDNRTYQIHHRLCLYLVERNFRQTLVPGSSTGFIRFLDQKDSSVRKFLVPEARRTSLTA